MFFSRMTLPSSTRRIPFVFTLTLVAAITLTMTGEGAWETNPTDGHVEYASQAALPTPSSATDTAASPDLVDRHSFANPREARVTHVSLDLRADFTTRVLEGTARLSLTRTAGQSVVLDTNGLTIVSVTSADGESLEYQLGAVDPVKGQPLTVHLPPIPHMATGVGAATATPVMPATTVTTATSATTVIVVRYRTAPGATALQWLMPAQTAGKTKPYLFSQGQAILTRSWIPTQDSPGIRQSYDARIVVPEGLRAAMSAEQLTPDGEPANGGRAFRFRLEQPIAPYLIALAIGDIARRDVGPRTAVYAEPSVLDAAAREFVDLEKMVAAAEALYGPYRWGRYDVLVLPPSFPYGGMENPRLTFLTPTLLAGDRSLVSVVAHELAHSWSGNLVTNATWRDFWLNEGFTTYFELRIMETLYGAERASMLEVLERAGMMKELADLGRDNPATQLHLPDTADDPDASMSDLAYSKGSAFLRMLEQRVGRVELDEYLRGYFNRRAFTSLTTPEFAADMKQHLLRGDEARYRALLIDEWLERPGLPANATTPKSALLDQAAASASRFAQDGRSGSLTVSSWSTQQWVAFLDALPRMLPVERLDTLERAFHMNDKANSEVLFSWLALTIARHYDPAVPALERFLTAQGRRKYVQPLFEALASDDWGRPIATRIYARAREGYHPLTAAAVDRVLGR